MKYKITIEDQTYLVEVGDLNARPVIATVDGDPFEVWVEEEASAPAVYINGNTSTVKAAPTAPAARPPMRKAALNNASGDSAIVYAPIPGVIDSVSVQAGDKVEVGQQLCVLEAMKMKNIIRATRAGTVATVHVSAGQQVKHHDPLIEYNA